MSRPLKKPNFDAEQILRDLVADVTDSYNSPDDDEQEHKPLATVAEEFRITPLKVRKLLITGGEYETAVSQQINRLYASSKTIAEIQKKTHLGRASVQSYLPYRKGVYNAAELSTDAERVKLYRARREAVAKLAQRPELLWDTVALFAGYPFRTAKGVKFTYVVIGDKLLVSREELQITRASVEEAYQRVVEDNAGKAELDDFRAAYIYPIFARFGLVKK